MPDADVLKELEGKTMVVVHWDDANIDPRRVPTNHHASGLKQIAIGFLRPGDPVNVFVNTDVDPSVSPEHDTIFTIPGVVRAITYLKVDHVDVFETKVRKVKTLRPRKKGAK